MSKNKKIWMLVLALAPLIGLFFYFIFFFFFFFSVIGLQDQAMQSQELPSGFLSGFAGLFILIFFIAIAQIASMVIYIINAVNHPLVRANENHKIIWIVAMIFGSPIAQIVYWYLYIWKEKGL